METGCEGVLGYRSPGRFRAVCPLLARRADGNWACSVNTEQVRPFWGRAFALLGGSALALAFTTSLAVFALLRGIGYEIRYTQVVWPPAWREFRQVQADYYLERAREARAAGDMSGSLLHLSNAYELNRDYRTGILLAQLWQAGQPLLSDQTYARIFADHPEQRPEIAQAWYRALLARGDFGAIHRVAGERLLHSGPAPSSAWTQAFLFATRQMGDPSGIARLLEEPETPPSLVPLLQLERSLYVLGPAERADALAAAAARSLDPFTTYHVFQRLLEERRGDLVLPLLTSPGTTLGDRENARLRLDTLAILGRETERAALVRQLLSRPTHPAICELLSAHLIVHPNLALMTDYSAKLAREPLPAGDAVYPQLLAFFAACGVHRDPDLLRDAAQRVQTAAGRDFRTLTSIETAFLQPRGNLRPGSFLPVLQPLPLEVTYALYAHYTPPPPFPPAP